MRVGRKCARVRDSSSCCTGSPGPPATGTASRPPSTANATRRSPSTSRPDALRRVADAAPDALYPLRLLDGRARRASRRGRAPRARDAARPGLDERRDRGPGRAPRRRRGGSRARSSGARSSSSSRAGAPDAAVRGRPGVGRTRRSLPTRAASLRRSLRRRLRALGPGRRWRRCGTGSTTLDDARRRPRRRARRTLRRDRRKACRRAPARRVRGRAGRRPSPGARSA